MKLPFFLLVALGTTSTPNVYADEESSSLRGGKVKETNDQNERIISIPLIPYQNHPRVDEIERFQKSNNMDRRRRHHRRRQLEQRGFQTIMNKETGEQGQVIESRYVDQLFQGYGTHYADVWVGTPVPQRQTVIVDTGSWATAFPCSKCSDCGEGSHIDAYFNESMSSTFERVLDCDECLLGDCKKGFKGCALSTAYSEGSSWRAYEAQDLAYTGGSHDKPSEENTFLFNFGCQTKITGLFKTQLADGIMGMEMDETVYWHQWYESFKDQNYKKKFSLCFSRQNKYSRSGTPAGAMTMGGTDVRLHRTKMLYVNQLNDSGWFAIRIRKMYLRLNGGSSVSVDKGYKPDDVIMKQIDVSEEEINHEQTIVDSGTTDTYMSEDIGRPFKKLWKEITGTNYNHKHHHLTEEQVANLPTIVFQLKADPELNEEGTPGLAGDLDPSFPMDVLVAMPPSHYLEYRKSSKKFTSRLYFEREGGGTLGANFMMGHEILFDVENQIMGFAESDCNYSNLVYGDEAPSEEEESSE